MPKVTTTDQISEHVREFVDKGEQALTDARERWNDTLRDLVPGDGDRVRKVIDDAFDFTERLLRNERDFANAVLDALLGDGAAKRAPAASRPRTAKGTATTKRASKPKAATPASAA